MISVLIADDSIFIRKRVARILEIDKGIKVIGSAVNGADAIDKIRELNPDVVTLDVEMPVMNGLEALSRIVGEFRIPVIMLSALTKEGADVTMRALEIGAVDFIPKPSVADENEMKNFGRDLILKIRGAADSRIEHKKKEKSMTAGAGKILEIRKKMVSASSMAVAIGISTGGPRTLLDVIPRIPANFPSPVFIAQHMPEGFTRSLAERLDAISKIKVKEAKNGEIVQPSVCYIAPGGKHMKIMHMTLSKGVMIRISDEPTDALYKPSVDVLLSSVAEIYGSGAVGVVMTGMGRDGTKGMKDIKTRGGVTITEDKSTCVVYGMPKSVEEAGYADYVAPAPEIPDTIVLLIG